MPATSLSPADETLRTEAPALWAALSPLGRRLFQPANFLPQQTADARGTAYNGTIGQITDGQGRPLPLEPMEAALSGLPEAARNRAFLYSPVEGIAEVRAAWRERQRQEIPDDIPSSLPIATSGRELAISALAEIFLESGRTALVASPDPASFEDLLTLHTGARLESVALDGDSLSVALRKLPPGEAAFLLISGADVADRAEVVRVLETAERPVVVVCDAGEGLDPRPWFWDLVGRSPHLVPFLVDGPAESFPGAGLAFLTLPFAPGSDLAVALESKVKTLLRAVVGSPPSLAQMIWLESERRSA
ncbi:MAG TPA: hypothetical protein VGS22_09005 [Thermoanaerobaculia bacterium]|nr:hypothetical protein [Thermoanaerobaculia bacterium]